MPRRFLLVLLLTGSLLAAPPALSQARSLYFGISANTRSSGSAGAADAAAETGITRIREDLEWFLVEPSNDAWDWSKPDLMYEEAAKRGLSILPIPGSPPCWATFGSTNCSENPILSASEYAEFVGEVAARYGPNGDFWDDHPGLDGKLASRHIEILNEPYWKSAGGSLTPYGYANLYKAAVIAGRAANPSTRYLVASAIGGSNGEWLSGLYSAEPSIGSYIDAIAVHPYPGSHGISYPPGSITDESFLNAKLNYEEWKARGVNKPVWITEVGYSSCNDPEHCVPGSTQAARETQKASMLKPLLDVLGTDEYGFVHAVYLYNLRQTTPVSEPNDKKSNWYGITFGGGYEHLPAWTTFVEAVESYDGTPDPSTSITSQSISGESATFNFTSNDPTSAFSCQLDGGSWTGCSSPKTYGSTGGGSHTFNVRATNAEAVDATPATYSWVTPPGATTESATGVKGTEAVLNGSANPRGTATSYYFDYGTTTAYGSTMPASPKAIGSGTSAVKVSESISGLTGNTTYHFRVVAENASGGITKGADLTFKTAKTMASSLSSLPLIEPFDGSTGIGSGPFMPNPFYWYKFPWAGSKGQDTTTGWGPFSAAPSIDGAYYAKNEQSYKDSPSGGAVGGTVSAGPSISGQYLSVWLVDGSGVFTPPKGYELRITRNGAGLYDLSLFKLDTAGLPPTGVRTTMAATSNYALAGGAKVALADTGGVVSAWVDQGSGFKEILSASDAAYSNGWVGLSGSGTTGRLVNFKGGAL